VDSEEVLIPQLGFLLVKPLPNLGKIFHHLSERADENRSIFLGIRKGKNQKFIFHKLPVDKQ
jgi:hypothetical protein